MDQMQDKIDELIKALKQSKNIISPAPLATIPALKPIKAPSMVVSSTSNPKLPAPAPDAKKDPKKIAQQIRDGAMSTKTQKIMLKSETLHISPNGQWTLI